MDFVYMMHIISRYIDKMHENMDWVWNREHMYCMYGMYYMICVCMYVCGLHDNTRKEYVMNGVQLVCTYVWIHVCVCVTVYNTTKESVEIDLFLELQLTATRIILLQELIESNPTASNAHHDSAAQNANQAQLLGVSKLQKR